MEIDIDRLSWCKWEPGDPVTINRIVWAKEEMQNIAGVLSRDWFGALGGQAVAELEARLADLSNREFVTATNSGSSALLVLTQAMVKEGIWPKGGLILHPACTFPTSIAPVWQMGLTPLFVDIESRTYQIDPLAVERAVDEHGNRIVGALIPFLLGNIPNLSLLFDVLSSIYSMAVIFDSCDTIGGRYIDGTPAAAYGMATAYSFYASHHITAAGAGGAALTSDPQIHDRARSAVYWGREFVRTDDPYYDFCQRYTYQEVGYDMQLTEIQAAFALAQIDRLFDQNKRRKEVFEDLRHQLTVCQKGHWLELPAEYSNAEPSWFGYPVLVREEAPFDREVFVRYLLKHKIEIRPLFAGNILKQKAYRSLPRVECGPFVQADRCAERAFFLPCWAMPQEAEAYMLEVLCDFLGAF